MIKFFKKRITIYIMFFVVIMITNIYFFRKNFNSQENTQAVNPFIENLESEINNRYFINKQASILENKLFKELKKIGEWPVSPQKIGRTNPFLPFFE
ncbi:hypothetical protein COV56_02310 [Candidatus Kuenenbacteria bacterium CG11_big_fil_rev_8_21_14_0_20_37_9]|uniref:Uncharacterized protein n=2 Tax=Candidatus Kueneniibacteriota TaxID=1752740 RepID=A0A2M6XT35_9BACT|nr:MAG: hypothetical protein AUJ29_01555 [Candidatus Kuenenbacteria bacterium CG1_02_38_13]PIR05526.1 MAG: hypothetical protein COV56_02310 [Candidatus Kuenenbacteria bacterium CG11_big_fil_rev_8_21_14_0_20_37_9]PIU10813.1 MAG: hypothetical protein COT27_01095 [Candidatus Kuenenbacteria bacterium CG08_land_8_20_14_0_20_37_23]